MKFANGSKAMLLATLGLCAGHTMAATITVPNGDFQTLYKPGSTTITATVSTWTGGTGSNVPVAAGGTATYSDSTTGSNIDTPGWVGAGAIQPGTGSGGSQGFAANGGGFGAGNGEFTTSAAPLTTVQAGLDYILTVNISDTNGGNPSVPIVMQLLANGT